MKKILLVAGVFMILLTAGYTFITLSPEEELIIGTWIPEGTTDDNRLVFKENGTVEDYDEDIIFATYYWTIYKETSPVCGEVVPVSSNYSYLREENVADPNDVYCYEIMALNNEILQLRYFGKYKWTSYTRQ